MVDLDLPHPLCRISDDIVGLDMVIIAKQQEIGRRTPFLVAHVLPKAFASLFSSLDMTDLANKLANLVHH
ncbi:hypothetical protein NKH70_10450 [Mesorhizobium sp. M0991]|uniref:hypothetical protein n=1 Tax=Mesorhizobium sp. M0991 TaxID=2957043 RepID=UPI00333DEFB2